LSFVKLLHEYLNGSKMIGVEDKVANLLIWLTDLSFHQVRCNLDTWCIIFACVWLYV